MNNLSNLPKPFFVLAPMYDVTDTVFRQIIASCAAPDLFFTEFVNADGLQSPGKNKLIQKLRFISEERPIIAQIWGKIPENFYKTAQELVAMGFDGIDINMGCPIKKIIKNGCCVALINNHELAVEIIQATHEGASGKVPVSVKTRLGFNNVDLTWHELLLKQKIDMLSVHGRTKKQLSNAPADWNTIGEIRKLRDQLISKTLIVGNGDVMSRIQGLELATRYNLDGIMIGRGVFSDPFVFSKTSPWASHSRQQRIDLFARHIKLFASTWKHGEQSVVTLNKFCKIYINGFDGAKELREQLMRANSTTDLLNILT